MKQVIRCTMESSDALWNHLNACRVDLFRWPQRGSHFPEKVCAFLDFLLFLSEYAKYLYKQRPDLQSLASDVRVLQVYFFRSTNVAYTGRFMH